MGLLTKVLISKTRENNTAGQAIVNFLHILIMLTIYETVLRKKKKIILCPLLGTIDIRHQRVRPKHQEST